MMDGANLRKWFRGRGVVLTGALVTGVFLCLVILAYVVKNGTSALPSSMRAESPLSSARLGMHGSQEAQDIDGATSADDAMAKALDDKTGAIPTSGASSRRNALMLQGALLEKRKCEYWLDEDKIYKAKARYAAVRDEYRKKAGELLAAEPSLDADSMRGIAQREIDAFWNAGGLASTESYEHGYLAWAIMEIACERDPDNFALLGQLAEAANTMTVALDADGTKYSKDAFDVLWPIVERQHSLVVSGKAPRSPETVIAMSDWTNMCSMRAMFDGAPKQEWARAEVPGCEWLVANAEAYGCGKLLPDLRVRLQMMRDGKPCSVVCLAPSVDQRTEEGIVVWAQHFRRMLTIRGSKQYREKLVKLWEADSQPQ